MDLAIKIPAINKEWQVPKGRNWLNEVIYVTKKVKNNYFKEFQNASKLTGLDVNIILGFGVIESGGAKNETLNGYSKGVMQVNVDTAWSTLRLQLKSSTLGMFYPLYLGCKEIFVVKKSLPSDFWSNSNVNIRNQKASDYFEISKMTPSVLEKVRKCILSDAQFAINVGAFFLAQLINGTIKKVGEVRLDHVVMKYNAGTGSFAKYITNKGLEKSSVDTLAFYNAVPQTVTRKYIIQLLGINGVLDVLQKGLV